VKSGGTEGGNSNLLRLLVVIYLSINFVFLVSYCPWYDEFLQPWLQTAELPLDSLSGDVAKDLHEGCDQGLFFGMRRSVDSFSSCETLKIVEHNTIG